MAAVDRGTLLGRYRLRALLGTGGMAEVWSADVEGPAGFARRVVLKRVLPHLARDEHFVQMFLQEARLSARLDHPNVMKVFELGTIEGEYFLTMEYVRGADLNKLLRHGFRPPVGMVATIMQGVCRALHHAHTLCDEDGAPLHIIHRDVSPSNVMLARDGTVKLFDFGIAKALAAPSDRQTATGTLKGKHGYMAPEVIKGAKADHRADIFAAGVVFHELLTGKRLFKAETDWLISMKVLNEPITPPSTVRSDIPESLDVIVLRALERDPDQRYASAEALADALSPYTEGWDIVRMQRELTPVFAELERIAPSALPITPSAPPDGKVAPTRLDRTPSARSTPAPKPSRTLALTLAGLGSAALLGAGWVGLHRFHLTTRATSDLSSSAGSSSEPVPRQPDPMELGSPGKPASAGQVPAASRPEDKAAATVSISFESTPTGASVVVDDVTLGVTPCTISLPRSATRRDVEVRKPGWQTIVEHVTPDVDQRLRVAMRPLHRQKSSERPLKRFE